MAKTELRYVSGVELRQRDGSEYVDGYVVQYDDTFEVVFGDETYRERVAPGAMKPERRFAVNVEHSPTVIGAFPNNVSLRTDDKAGLGISVRLPDTTAGRDVRTMLNDGILNGFSAEMRVNKAEFKDGVRVIQRAQLVGVGLVSVPAYERSTAELRSAFAEYEPPSDPEPVKLTVPGRRLL